MSATNIKIADHSYGYAFGVDGLMTITETQRFLGVSRRTIYRLIESGELRRGRIGGRTVICRRSVQAFAQSVED